MHAEDKKQDY